MRIPYGLCALNAVVLFLFISYPLTLYAMVCTVRVWMLSLTLKTYTIYIQNRYRTINGRFDSFDRWEYGYYWRSSRYIAIRSIPDLWMRSFSCFAILPFFHFRFCIDHWTENEIDRLLSVHFGTEWSSDSDCNLSICTLEWHWKRQSRRSQRYVFCVSD